MNDFTHTEKKHRNIGIIVSIAVHVLLLVLFLWATAWKEPYPPLPEYGIELNFGMNTPGTGEEAVAADESETVEDVVEESNEEVEEAVEETVEQPIETAVDQISEEVQEAVEEVATQEESPVKAEDSKTPEQNPVEKVKEEVKEPEKPKANPNALFPGSNTSQGDQTNAKGDQGKADGQVDADALMGPQGGGSDSELDMAGWKWDSPPRPNDPSEQNGIIVFDITVDSNGEVISVVAREYTLSADIVKIYKEEVEKLTFSKNSGGITTGQSKGTITFKIRSK